MEKFDPSKTHHQYDALKSTWKMCRDCVVGQRAIHAAGVEYLPKLAGQSDETYAAYKKRALFMNATGRTLEGMTGLVFRKYPKIALPDALKPYEEDIDMEGVSLAGLAQSIVDDVISVGRAGVMVEYPARDDVGAPLTVEQSRAQGIRPYLTRYKAEDVINWEFGRVRNETRLVRVFITEQLNGEKDAQIRELHLDDGVYGQRIWERSGKGWVVSREIHPRRNGQAITKIPFWFCQPKEGRGDVQNPPIENLCYVNLAHYMNSADLENGAHVAGLPTPWVNGVDDPANFPELHLGSNTVLTLPPNAMAGFLQCGDQGFATIEKAMDRKEQQMAALGARMLSPEKKQAETEGALEIKRGGENSVLATLAASVDMSLSAALKFMAEWVGADPKDAYIELNKDFIPTSMTAADLKEWVATLQAGAISYLTFFEGLKKGELVAENQTAEEEQERIKSERPSVSGDPLNVD